MFLLWYLLASFKCSKNLKFIVDLRLGSIRFLLGQRKYDFELVEGVQL
jgi:hypothetical protein